MRERTRERKREKERERERKREREEEERGVTRERGLKYDHCQKSLTFRLSSNRR